MSITDAQNATTDLTDTKAFLGSDKGILMLVALFVGIVALITVTFGLPGLAMSALAMVPVIYTVLILITVGK